MEKQPDLVTLVIDAHGGMKRWEEIQSIEVKADWRGDALEAKGPPGHYHPTCHVDTKNIRVTFQGLGHGSSSDRLIYTPSRVWIERGDGTIISSRDNPYEAFTNHTYNTIWDDLHLVTFAGYALHNYMTFPFHLRWAGFQSREVEGHEESGEHWRCLEVTFPDYYPTHSKVGLFYFDKDFMVRRFDYAPAAFKLPAAHYTYDFKDFGGIKIPTLRRVLARRPDGPKVDGEWPLRGQIKQAGPSGFVIIYTDVVVHDEKVGQIRAKV